MKPKNRLLLVALAVVGLMPTGQLRGQNFTTLHSFNASDGATPYAGLILSGNTLYGTTLSGGGSGIGTVFALSTDGTGFRTVHEFSGWPLFYYTNREGAHPFAGLISSGNTLYGTAAYGGRYANGTIFAVHTDGTGFTNLHNFTNSDGAGPLAALILSGNTLYGTAAYDSSGV
jgi:uncharacterized repeat protein (TIGR03803 family)